MIQMIKSKLILKYNLLLLSIYLQIAQPYVRVKKHNNRIKWWVPGRTRVRMPFRFFTMILFRPMLTLMLSQFVDRKSEMCRRTEC